MSTSAAPPARRFTLLALTSLALASVVGLGAAQAFGLVTPAQVAEAVSSGALPLLVCILLLAMALQFRYFLAPIYAWLGHTREDESAPFALHRRMASFSLLYWSSFVLYALLVPPVFMLASGMDLRAEGVLSEFILLQLAVAVLTALPAYLLALDRLGRLVAFMGLVRVQVSLKSKLMLIGGLVPLLSYALLLHYFARHAIHVSGATLALWTGLALVTIAATALSIRSMTRSLAPVQQALRRSGATTHGELAQLKACSLDEVGYLTQMLGKLFRRLRDQESHVRAVVDTAAEGIIVVNEQGEVDTFNAAAEKLFGYRAQEIRGRPLAWLLPDSVTAHGAPQSNPVEQEVVGLHRSGMQIPMSIRVSEMRLRGKRMFTCLVADISVRKAAEQELLRAEKRYRDLVETAHDLVWSVDPEGRWTYINDASRHIYGLAPEAMLGRHISEFQDAKYAERDAGAFAAILNGQELVQYETVHLDQSGKPHHLSFSARTHTDVDGKVIQISGTARDITERKAFESRLAYQAEHDSLTGLFNRHYFQQELERVVARVARSGNPCALFYVDLDQFKYINDTLGHAAGDRLLIEISTLLSEHVRGSDLLARFGGDEFTILLYDVDQAHVLHTAENLRAHFDRYKFYEDGKAFNITCSIGAALIDADARSADEVMSHADIACNLAKSQGRNRANLYNPDDKNKAGMAEDMGWAARVRDMLEHDRLQLVYQPILSVTDGRIQDYEVLMRMLCDDGEVILPGGFMPAAERFGLIHSVDRWIVQKAMHKLAELHASGNKVSFSINLSGRAFEDQGLLPHIRAMLDETGLAPELLTFEITETAAIANLKAATRFIQSLKDIGCQFALDDFGAGFCSFTYLKHLPVDKLKIDGSFVQSMANAPVDQAMVQSMNQVAHALGKRTVAEYVENAQTLELLKQYGVDLAQGNFLGKPQESIHAASRPTLITARAH